MVSWYQTSKLRTALRKNVMRADLHVHVGELSDFNNPNDMAASVKSVLTSAIIKGIDVVGVLGHEGPEIAWKAREIAKQSGIDIYVIPGQEYLCADGLHILVYLLKKAMPPNMNSDQAITYAHKNSGFVMAITVSKRQSQHLNKIKGTPSAPDAVEIYNAVTGGYQDIDVDYPKFVCSASKTPKDMENLNVFTLINRNDLAALGLMPKDEGVDYLPNYLKHDEELQQNGSPTDPKAQSLPSVGGNYYNQ